jgi:hypothetical protein
VYVLQKHINMSTTFEYVYDDMALPKDTNQDVATYMEEVYDPEVSRQQFAAVKDVQPGQEALHRQGMAPNSGSMQRAKTTGSEEDRKMAGKWMPKPEDIVRRPPAPPGGLQ